MKDHEMPTIKHRLLALVPVAFGLLLLARSAAGEDLLQIYRDAQRNDPAIAAAKASWDATQEALPQARAGLLPNASASAQRLGEPIRRDDQDRSEDERKPTLRAVHGHRVGVAAAVPPAELDCLRPGEAAGRAGRQRAGNRAAGPDPARRPGLLRRAARAVQHRAEREPEGRGFRAARAGETQFRGWRSDDHRHQRGAGQVRLDRRAGNHDPQRLRQQGDGAARDHRPPAEGIEDGRRRVPGDAAGAEPARLLGRPGAEGESARAGRREEFRDRHPRGRPGEGRPLSDARPRRQRELGELRRRLHQPRRLQLFVDRHDRRPTRGPHLPGRLRRLQGASGDCAARQDPPGPRTGTAHRALSCADRLHGGHERGSVDQGIRPGALVGRGCAAVEQARAGSRHPDEPRRAERAAERVLDASRPRAGRTSTT